MLIENITKTKAMFAHQSICNSQRLKPIACELLFRGFDGLSLQDFIDEPSLFVTHIDELTRGKADAITSLYATHDYAVYLVNFTPCQIASPYFIDSLTWFDRSRIPASSIVIEITELPLDTKDDEAFLNNLAFARGKGHLIALDDFGVGSSNFSRVLSLSPDIVKLDADLLHLASESDAHKHALRALVSFIHETGAKCIVEGVETEDMLDVARASKADFLQGFYLSRPTLLIKPTSLGISNDYPRESYSAFCFV